MLAFYPNQIAYTSLLSTEILFQFLTLLGAVLFVYAEGRMKWFFLAGLAWGLAVLTKPQAVFIPALFLLVFLWRKKGFVLRAAIVIYATLLLTVAPWMARNYRIFGKPLLSTNGGIVLLIGNNPYATGNHIWDENVRSLIGEYGQNEDQIFGVKELARDEKARQVALAFIIHNPGKDLLLWPRKFVATYKSDVDGFYYTMGMLKDRSNVLNFGYLALRILGELYYVAIMILFLVSIPGILVSKIPGYRIGLFITAYFTLIYLVYAGNARYHFAQMPWIMLCVGLGITQMLKSEPHTVDAGVERQVPLSKAATA